MAIEKILNLLEGVKPSGKHRWLARCPSHGDKHPSLSVKELDDGRVLVHCFAGCGATEVLSSIGLEFTDLYPENAQDHLKPERRPFPAADILKAVGFEALVVMMAGTALLAGQPFSQIDRDRLTLAVSRIQAALDYSGVSK